MRGVLKSVSGDIVKRRVPGLPPDGYVEVTLLLDPPTFAELDALKANVGRGYYAVLDSACSYVIIGNNNKVGR